MANWKSTAFAVLALSLCAGSASAQTCASQAPGSGWVCQDGGWLPPGHPAIRTTDAPAPAPAPPPPSGVVVVPQNHAANQWIVDRVRAGLRLPSGVVPFVPPLIIHGRDVKMLRGAEDGLTRLSPVTNGAGELVQVFSDMPGDPAIGYPHRMLISDLWIAGYPAQTCLAVHGAAMTFERVEISGCGTSVSFPWVVNVTFRDSRFVGGATGWFIPANAVATTLRCSGCQFSYYAHNALYTGTVQGLVLDDSTIIEYNAGRGIHAGCGSQVLTRDVWFERNGTHLYDPCGAVTVTGVQGVR